MARRRGGWVRHPRLLRSRNCRAERGSKLGRPCPTGCNGCANVPDQSCRQSFERLLAIAAHYCDGLNVSTRNPNELKEACQLVERFCSELGRPAPPAVEAQLWVRDLWPDARAHLRAFEAAGAEAVILVLDEERGPDAVLGLADTVL